MKNLILLLLLILFFFKVDTKHGFITNSTKSNYFMSEIEPYQYSSEMRGEETLRSVMFKIYF